MSSLMSIECFAQFGVMNSIYTFDLLERENRLLFINRRSEYHLYEMQLGVIFFAFFASALSSVSTDKKDKFTDFIF